MQKKHFCIKLRIKDNSSKLKDTIQVKQNNKWFKNLQLEFSVKSVFIKIIT